MHLCAGRGNPDLTLVVDRPPQPVFTAADRNHHFIEVPMIARSRPRTADIGRDRRPELQEPPPDRLVGCVNTSLGQQFLDIPKGQGEPGIEPDRVANDFWREAVALKRYRSYPMMLIGDQPQSYPSYRDIASASSVSARKLLRQDHRLPRTTMPTPSRRSKSADGMSVSMPTSLRHDARRSSIKAPWRTKGPPSISGRPLDCFIEVAA